MKLDKFTYKTWSKPNLDVYYHLPDVIDEDTEVIFIIHGNSRNADNYLETWIARADGENVALFAPHFKRSQFPSFNTLQMSTSKGVIRENRTLYLNNSIDELFVHIKSLFGLNDKKYNIYGHSAGAQFVHRYLLTSDSPAVDIAIAANAGWYTFLNGANFPYGIKNPPVSLNDSNVKKFLKTNLHILIGSKDTDVDSSVNQSEGAQKQGFNRFQRANNFLNTQNPLLNKIILNLIGNFRLCLG